MRWLRSQHTLYTRSASMHTPLPKSYPGPEDVLIDDVDRAR